MVQFELLRRIPIVNMYRMGMTFLYLLLRLSACETDVVTQYCVLNQDALRLLVIGQSWKRDIGMLDETSFNCRALSHPPTIT